MDSALIPVDQLQVMAKAVSESRLFSSIDTPQKAMVLMMICQAEGRNAAEAVTRYHIIEGKPSKQAHAILSDFQAAGGTMKYLERTDTRVSAEFTHPKGGTIKVDWDMERAKTAGLAARGTWLKYPRQMLTARVISEGVRAVYPASSGGLYTPEEVQDFDDKKPAPAALPIQVQAEVVPEPAKTPDPAPANPPPPSSDGTLSQADKYCAEIDEQTDAKGVSAIVQKAVKDKTLKADERTRVLKHGGDWKPSL